MALAQPLDTTDTTGFAPIGQRVLLQEAEALRHFAGQLPPDFSNAVQAILQCKGRVIVSGIGKSGHIGRKIAATLASTGTPSFFVHATEASHGDLGMITIDDICLILSNSGETRELGDIVSHTIKYEIPMIAISSRPHSTLMRAADYQLCLPEVDEACPMGIAPTTSTTLCLALGDALAVALMEQRNFQPQNFRVFHPGGTLSAQVAEVAQLMHKGDAVPIVDGAAPMDEVLITMTSKGFGTTAVVEAGTLVGVVTDGDLRRNMDHLMDATAREVATKNPISVPESLPAAHALSLMNAHQITNLFITNEAGQPVGIVHLHDLLRAGVA